MRRYIPEVLFSIGVTIGVVGFLAFIFSLQKKPWLSINGVTYGQENFFLIGGIRAGVGSGLIALGVLLIRSRSN